MEHNKYQSVHGDTTKIYELVNWLIELREENKGNKKEIGELKEKIERLERSRSVDSHDSSFKDSKGIKGTIISTENKTIINDLGNKLEKKIDWRKTAFPTKEEAQRFFKPSNKKNHSLCLKCNGFYLDERQTHHYRAHIIEETRQKNGNLGEKTIGPSPSEWHNGKYVLDEKNGKYQCLLCKQLFHISGTGTHWHSHFHKGETKLPSRRTYR